MKNNSSLTYSFLLLVGDFLALVSAFILAYVIRVKLDIRPLIEQVPAHTYILVFLLLLPFWIMIFAFLNMYIDNEVNTTGGVAYIYELSETLWRQC